MAVITKKIDDMDGTDASTTVRFSVDGRDMTIDLSDENAANFYAAMRPFLEAATTVEAPQKAVRATRGSGAPRAKAGFAPGYLEALRTWAKENGIAVAPKGRVKAEVLEQYAAHLKEEAETAKLVEKVKEPQ